MLPTKKFWLLQTVYYKLLALSMTAYKTKEEICDNASRGQNPVVWPTFTGCGIG